MLLLLELRLVSLPKDYETREQGERRNGKRRELLTRIVHLRFDSRLRRVVDRSTPGIECAMIFFKKRKRTVGLTLERVEDKKKENGTSMFCFLRARRRRSNYQSTLCFVAPFSNVAHREVSSLYGATLSGPFANGLPNRKFCLKFNLLRKVLNANRRLCSRSRHLVQ